MRAEKTVEKLGNGSPVTIVGLGDSLTQGWLVPKGYLAFLGEMLKEKYQESRVTILNKGIPGDTAQGGLLRLREDVIEQSPDCVLVQFALNDAYMGVPESRFGKFIQAIIDGVRNDTDAEVALVSSVFLDDPREYEMARAYYRRLESLALKNSLPYVAVHEYWADRIQNGGYVFRSLVQYDLIHPRVEGYRLMAEAVMSAL